MWNSTVAEDALGDYSWIVRLSKNLAGYLTVIIPFALCKLYLDRTDFERDYEESKKWFCKWLNVFFYGVKRAFTPDRKFSTG